MTWHRRNVEVGTCQDDDAVERLLLAEPALGLALGAAGACGGWRRGGRSGAARRVCGQSGGGLQRGAERRRRARERGKRKRRATSHAAAAGPCRGAKAWAKDC